MFCSRHHVHPRHASRQKQQSHVRPELLPWINFTPLISFLVLCRLVRGSLRAVFSVLCRLVRAPREQVRIAPIFVTKTARANHVFYHRHPGGPRVQARDGCGQKEKSHGRLGDSSHVGSSSFFLPAAVPTHWGTNPLCVKLFGRGEYIRNS